MNILSLGLGVQSTCLYYMSSLGELPKIDYAIFADTGGEKLGTLLYLEYLQSWQKRYNSIPIIHIKNKNLKKDILNNENSTGGRFSSIPAFTYNPDGTTGMLRRQCTNEYKIEQVDKAIRELYGLPARKRMPPTEIWKGITMDEIDRLSIPQQRWKTYVYPFVEYKTQKKETKKIDNGKRMTRNDVVNWYKQHCLPIPPKSSCTFCPYQSDEAWLNMKRNEPADWQTAIEIDAAIRNSTKKGINNPVFLHDSCLPLDQVKFNDNNNDLWKGECSGNCHI